MTRRTLLQTALAGAAAVPARPQSTPSDPESALQIARDRNTANAKSLAAVALSSTTEPAFAFKP